MKRAKKWTETCKRIDFNKHYLVTFGYYFASITAPDYRSYLPFFHLTFFWVRSLRELICVQQPWEIGIPQITEYHWDTKIIVFKVSKIFRLIKLIIQLLFCCLCGITSEWWGDKKDRKRKYLPLDTHVCLLPRLLFICFINCQSICGSSLNVPLSFPHLFCIYPAKLSF